MNWPTIVFGMALPWLLVILGSWALYQLVRQYGLLLLRLEAVEHHLSRLAGGQGEPAPLPVGSAAPEFTLPDLAGARHSLADLRGRKTLLIFFNPTCSFCRDMAADLAELEPEGKNGLPVPVVVTAGSAEDNRQLVKEWDLRCRFLLQEKGEVADRYRAPATPMGYLIDEQGRIASTPATGAPALLELADGKPKAKGKADKGLAASKLNREGLKAGTMAPTFRLPRLDGGELDLESFRGRRVVLVFSDPQCEPCDQLAPRLEEFHRREPGMALVMVSRRGAEPNQAKAAQFGFTFPVALQKSWEISKRYALFATPIAYLIDEQGTLLSDVAVGLEPIQALLERAVKASASVGA